MDILFENPLLIAIIIGIISAVFGKIGKQEENEEKSRQNKPAPQRKPMPERQAEQTSPDPVVTDQLDDFGDVHDHGGMKKKTSQSLQDRYTDTLAKMEERKSELNREFQSLERQLKRPKAASAEVKPKIIEKLNQDTVVQGMILGEVFGEPRAKKPHRTMKRPYQR
ncbi:hypothetical protein BK049_15590 [Bacillus xiamenensis]|uniref:Uncharacterized protein n=1 Tax=Bacillus xiamenensis TaxID=1178537 RepID=A0AAC9IHW0_9BACI|nr:MULTISPECIES: hypothetical protein [Bacillus]AOZ89990.1 hypothetical protein BK049_15590 [Bacillus xiamenensis]MBG9911108.1 hypothetical protein [Bacillus xiamenensis]MCW1837442.1 hypothetical protein [Bacillus xiamenensis]MCY9575436.1 hypothetical protein [Bacillus xiamenensis]QGX65404.1 hypothetical protein GPA07_08155 [Bacillus sp. ms-22]